MKTVAIGLMALSMAVSLFSDLVNSTEVMTGEEIGFDTITKQDYVKFLDKHLLGEISDCLQKKNPHMFMTKCYTTVTCDIEGTLIEQYKGRIYRPYSTKGSIVYIECGQRQHICSYEAFVSKDSVVVRESFQRPWQSASSFTKEFCAEIMKDVDEKPEPKKNDKEIQEKREKKLD